MSQDHEPWNLVRAVFPLVISLVVGIATILLVSLILPILIPVALVALVLGLVYLWFRSRIGRSGGPRYYD